MNSFRLLSSIMQLFWNRKCSAEISITYVPGCEEGGETGDRGHLPSSSTCLEGKLCSMPPKFLRTSDLARAVGLSVQAIRNYEAVGFLPATTRTAKGYRMYTPQHLQALQIAKMMIPVFGWWRTRTILSAIHQQDLATALKEIDARHAEIHRERLQIEETLRLIRENSMTLPDVLVSPVHSQTKVLHIREAAQMAGVRVSALRFWEEQGLLQPVRDKSSGYRLYDAHQIRKLQVIVLLRKANYDFPAINAVLDELSSGTIEQAFSAAEQRLQNLLNVSCRCVEATAFLWSYATKYHPISISSTNSDLQLKARPDPDGSLSLSD